MLLQFDLSKLTSDQWWHVASNVAQYGIFPFMGWLYKRAKLAVFKSLNEMITDNSNRIRDELLVIMDKKFEEHEQNAFCRLDEINKNVSKAVAAGSGKG
jgi:hypothetical protein